jgi:hypothetical protein
MNLQEQISRIHEVMGTINESKFFHRRVNLDKIKELLKLHAQQVFYETNYETKSYDRFKYELTLKAVEASIWQDFGLGWEDLSEEEEIEFVTDVSNHLDKEIKGLYKNYRK